MELNLQGLSASEGAPLAAVLGLPLSLDKEVQLCGYLNISCEVGI
jgi:hypothetical protein